MLNLFITLRGAVEIVGGIAQIYVQAAQKRLKE